MNPAEMISHFMRWTQCNRRGTGPGGCESITRRESSSASIWNRAQRGVGQVIVFGSEAVFRPVFALSWVHLLVDIADELEPGIRS